MVAEPTEELAGFRPCNLPRAEIEALAERVAEHFGLPDCSLGDVVRRLGGKIKYEPLLDLCPEDGSIIVRARNDFTIVLPVETGECRDRFTIAHELGHYFLHSNQGARPGIARRRAESERLEWEANWFAGALLMPAQKFRLSHKKHGGELRRVAVDFGVSQAACQVRAKVLGLD